MKATTIAVVANPYHALDAKGRLSGGCPEGELPRPPGVPSPMRLIDCERTMTGGSYVPDSADPGLRIAVSDRNGNLGMAPYVMSTADVFLAFKGEVHEFHIGDRRLEHYYSERVKHDEVLEANDGKPPLRKLAEMRLAAIKNWVAHYGDEPLPFEVWEKQYPHEKAVAAEQVKLEQEIAEKAAKAKADAEAKAKEAADAKAKAEAEAKAKAAKPAAPVTTSDATKGS